MNNKNFKYLYIISSYSGGRGNIEQGIYKMNSNTEEMRKACKADFQENNPEVISGIHLCETMVIEINNIGIDAFIKDGDECCKKYQQDQKDIEKRELAELERLQKKYNQ